MFCGLVERRQRTRTSAGESSATGGERDSSGRFMRKRSTRDQRSKRGISKALWPVFSQELRTEVQ